MLITRHLSLKSKRMKLHAATKILIWLMLAISMQWLSLLALSTLSVVLLLLILYTKAYNFIFLLRRSKWLMLSLCLIYGLATPGEPMVTWLGLMSPSIQGVQSGMLQIWRLTLLLAGLSLVFVATAEESLISGLYVILKPLALIGINAEQISLRVWLTLIYAKKLSKNNKLIQWKSFSEVMRSINTAENEMKLDVYPIPKIEIMVLIMSLIASGAYIL